MRWANFRNPMATTRSRQANQNGDELPLHPTRPLANATTDPEHTLTTKAAQVVRDVHDTQDWSSRPPSNFSSASFRSSPGSPSPSPPPSLVASPGRASPASEVQPLPTNVQNLVESITHLA